MQLKKIISYGRNQLKTVSNTSLLDAEILVAFVLDITRTKLFLNEKQELTSEQEKQIFQLIKRRKKSEPIAYLINEKEFFGQKFYVDQRVLIPRPDTEVLVEKVVEFVEDDRLKKVDTKKILIIDVGTGSGCISICLAQKIKHADFLALDISSDALVVAKKNIQTYHLSDKIKLLQSNLLQKVFEMPKIDKTNLYIVANLPYIRENEKLMPDVQNFEPVLALLAGSDGLKYYQQLLQQAIQLQPKAIFLEIDSSQVNPLQKLSKSLFPHYTSKVYKDLSQKNRVFSIIAE